MYETNTRYMLVTRMNEERLAEARRSHLLREAREDQDAAPATRAVTVTGPRVSLRTAVGALRRAAHGHGIQGAAAR